MNNQVMNASSLGHATRIKPERQWVFWAMRMFPSFAVFTPHFQSVGRNHQFESELSSSQRVAGHSTSFDATFAMLHRNLFFL